MSPAFNTPGLTEHIEVSFLETGGRGAIYEREALNTAGVTHREKKRISLPQTEQVKGLKVSEMLVAVTSGVVETADGALHEVTRGVSRIAEEVLEREPQYGDYFERGVTARGTDSERSEIRAYMPDGRVIAG